jgi:hypothetical protein
MKSLHLQFSMLCGVLLLAGCNGGSELSGPPVLPSAPAPSSSGPASRYSTWRVDGILVTATGTCDWLPSIGRTSTVFWGVTITGDSVVLEDKYTFPADPALTGVLSGRQFIVVYKSEGEDGFGESPCAYKGGTLTGTFSEDFSSFEAVETHVYGPAGGETTIQWRWIGSPF